ncbi:PH domain-containing protein [Lihuaxuella thermophila]|uniref:PH domain-containing protein n=1 Tax=Lihuaxuella thermophila TaxID=1173111 RepID=A0A1H8DYS1_9BACL|nr:PH domain-containing protein [Lihuaxuella thermophila]SEN12335.1 PH domain-containing protein [Lihuaxuella thermophila]
MSLFGGANTRKHVSQACEYLYEGEELIQTYGMLLDFVALTTRRILFVDSAVFSRKTAVISIPYSRVESIALEKGDFWSRTNKVEIQTKAKTYCLEFRKEADVIGFYQTLSYYICH